MKNEVLDMAGGFADQTGGAYILKSASIEAADSLIANDPMNQEKECTYTIKEWNVSLQSS